LYASISLTNNNSFLTFNDTGSPSKQQLFRRQSADQPLVYNASQSFATINGDTYNVSAYAQQAQNGANPPNCSITICVYNSCSTPALLQTGTWQQYYYLYLATYDDDSAPATFSITCVGNAYVGLDSVAIVDIPPPDTSTSAQPTDSGGTSSASNNGVSPASATDGSMSMTTLPGGSVRTVTRTIVRTRTTSAVVSTAIYYTTTQISYVVSTYESDNTYTTQQPTTIVSTVYATATSYQTFTVSAVVTSTSKWILGLHA
jgi:hypothetical protein